MTTIDEQILQAKRNIKSAAFYESESLDVEKAILASLERLKRIDEVQVPEEPNWLRLRNGFIGNADGSETPTYGQYATRKDYDTLRDLLRRESARADAIVEVVKQVANPMSDNIKGWKQRAESAEAKLAQIEKMGWQLARGEV
jgi:hypothetical protein